MHRNESGFEGDYTTKTDVLDNEYYQMILEAGRIWKQIRHEIKFEGEDQIRCAESIANH